MKLIKKVLITGGTGFIGKLTIKKMIEKDIECLVLTRQDLQDTNNVKYIKLDLNQLNVESANKIINKIGGLDAIIYMAASIPILGTKKETYFEAKTNTLDPLIKFCEYFIPITKKFIYISSIDIVGINSDLQYDESCMADPITPYAIGKYCGEIYANSICKQYGVSNIILRFSQVYGPNEPLVRVIPILTKAIKEDGVFNKYTLGEEKRRFLYVEDAASSIFQALKTNVTGIFNIAGKGINSINDLISICEKVYNKKANLSILGDAVVSDNVPSITKAKKQLNFEPKYTLEEGIRKIYEEEKK